MSASVGDDESEKSELNTMVVNVLVMSVSSNEGNEDDDRESDDDDSEDDDEEGSESDVNAYDEREGQEVGEGHTAHDVAPCVDAYVPRAQLRHVSV